MAKPVRYTERALKAIIIEADPSFYEDSNSQNQDVYEFSNGKKFMGRRLYANYTPIEEA